MFSIFQITTMDSWGSGVLKPIVMYYPGYAIFFIVFIFIVAFGLLNIVLGVIVESVVTQASSNIERQQKV